MLGGLACVASEIAQFERAVELFGAAERVGKLWGYAGDRIDQEEVDHRLAQAMAALDEESLRRAWERGQGMEPEAAIECALDGDAIG